MDGEGKEEGEKVRKWRKERGRERRLEGKEEGGREDEWIRSMG